MIRRKPLAPNNRKISKVGGEFNRSIKIYDKSPTNKGSVFAWLRAGRQNSEGFGGGNRITR